MTKTNPKGLSRKGIYEMRDISTKKQKAEAQKSAVKGDETKEPGREFVKMLRVKYLGEYGVKNERAKTDYKRLHLVYRLTAD